nr:MAG TPA: hypothetical protein [Caudoviricetes sp.]
MKIRKICLVLFSKHYVTIHLLSLAHKRVQLFVTNYLSNHRLV